MLRVRLEEVENFSDTETDIHLHGLKLEKRGGKPHCDGREGKVPLLLNSRIANEETGKVD